MGGFDGGWTPREVEAITARAGELGGVPGWEADVDRETGDLLLVEGGAIVVRLAGISLPLQGLGRGEPTRSLGFELFDIDGSRIFSFAVTIEDVMRGLDLTGPARR